MTECRPTPTIVSSCLIGMCTRYDGGECECQRVLSETEGRWIIPVCPEQLGGLPTPRPPAEIEDGDGRSVLKGEARVLRAAGEDVTSQFLRGAEQVRRLVGLYNVGRALFKEGSPSCGVTCIKRNGCDVMGCGVTAAILEREGIQVEGFN